MNWQSEVVVIVGALDASQLFLTGYGLVGCWFAKPKCMLNSTSDDEDVKVRVKFHDYSMCVGEWLRDC